MGKRRYRARNIKHIDPTRLCERLVGKDVVVAIDVAKEDMFAAVEDDGEVLVTIKWKHPAASRQFVALVKQLSDCATSTDVAMEPSGTYGDALRTALIAAGLKVYRVNPKHTNDAKEVYDGVPSIHDAKSAAIIAKLHRDGRSEAWPIRSDVERALTAALRVMEIHDKQFQQNRNRLTNLLARHWPELEQHLSLDSATLLELLMAFGGPQAVARDPDGARQLMRRVGGHFLSGSKIEGVVDSAMVTLGMPAVAEETRMLQHIAEEARRNQTMRNRARRRVEELSVRDGATQHLAPVVGKTTAAVLVSAVGDPKRYDSAGAYEKSLGLNLKEKSSGKSKGALHITKRGPGVARLYLWLAALRLIKSEPIVRAWYAKKVRRQGGDARAKAVVAVMRKLVQALWHVAGGQVFDATRLFDVRRLNLDAATLAELP